MKKIFFIFAMLHSLNLMAQTPSEWSVMGDKYYDEGDFDKATYAWTQGANGGSLSSMASLGWFYWMKKDHVNSEKWYLKCASHNVGHCQSWLGALYSVYALDAKYVDYDKAGYWLHQAAEKGEPDALMYLTMEGFEPKLTWKNAVNSTSNGSYLLKVGVKSYSTMESCVLLVNGIIEEGYNISQVGTGEFIVIGTLNLRRGQNSIKLTISNAAGEESIQKTVNYQ